MGNPGQDSYVSAGGSGLTGMKERELFEDQGFGVSLGLPALMCFLSRCTSALSHTPAILPSISLQARCLLSTSELCLLSFIPFPRLSSWKWPSWPRFPICAFTLHFSALCFCWFMPDLFPVPYFKFLRGRIWLAPLVELLRVVGHCPVYRLVVLRWGAHPEGVMWKEVPEDGCAGGGDTFLLGKHYGWHT